MFASTTAPYIAPFIRIFGLTGELNLCVLLLQAAAMNIAVGAQVWVEDPHLAWAESEVLEINGKQVKCRTIHGKEVIVPTLSLLLKLGLEEG